MKKWIVRWCVEGFNIREKFNAKEEAEKYYNKIINTIDDIYEIDMWEE